MKFCGWFCGMDGQSKAVFLSRFSWLASMGIVWIGLLAQGWQLVKYSMPATGMSVTAHYGLFRINYFGAQTFTSNYLDWEATQEDETAFARVQGARACVVLALGALAVQFLAALRLWCSRDAQIQRYYTRVCTAAAATDFAFTILALLVWKTISRRAFLVFCAQSGCTPLPDVPDAAQMTVYYSWGFFVVKAALAFPGVVALVYLATGSGGGGNEDGEADDEEAPAAVGKKAAVKGKGAEAAAATKAFKKQLSSKKGSSSSATSPKNGGKRTSKKIQQEEQDDEGEEEEDDEFQFGKKQQRQAGGDVEEGGDAAGEEEDPFPPKKASPKGGSSPKNGKRAFDRDAPVSYVGGPSGNPNPSWLTG